MQTNVRLCFDFLLQFSHAKVYVQLAQGSLLTEEKLYICFYMLNAIQEYVANQSIIFLVIMYIMAKYEWYG